MFRKDAQAQSAERAVRDLEERLTAYYGPVLPPYPLPGAAWIRLRDSLDQTYQGAAHRQHARRPAFERTYRRPVVPQSLREALTDLLQQVDYRWPSPELHCHFSARQVQPRVRGVPLGRRQVRLVLPARNWQFLQTVEMEVLLAVGLARAVTSSRMLYLLSRALLALSVLLVLASLPLVGVDRRYLGICCLAFVCCVAGGCLICWQERTQAFRGDLLAARWLGRERVCQGLHLLAGHGRPQRGPTWGEPPLAERIARICGSPVKIKDEHLTLVG
jgi:hypothetical protein